jgi:hypothetical protein
MGLPKGRTNNANGRPTGSTNKNTKELRELLAGFIENNWSSIQTDFDKLEPKDRLHFFEKIMQYTIPKMQNTTSESEQNQSFIVTLNLD